MGCPAALPYTHVSWNLSRCRTLLRGRETRAWRSHSIPRCRLLFPVAPWCSARLLPSQPFLGFAGTMYAYSCPPGGLSERGALGDFERLPVQGRAGCRRKWLLALPALSLQSHAACSAPLLCRPSYPGGVWPPLSKASASTTLEPRFAALVLSL